MSFVIIDLLAFKVSVRYFRRKLDNCMRDEADSLKHSVILCYNAFFLLFITENILIVTTMKSKEYNNTIIKSHIKQKRVLKK